MIKNPKYKGNYCANKVERLNYDSNKIIKKPEEEWINYKATERIPAIVSEELWDKANKVLNDRSEKCKNRKYTKPKKYAFSQSIYCMDDLEVFLPRRDSSREKNPIWTCKKYCRYGVKGCDSPKIKENDLYNIFSTILPKLSNDKDKVLEKFSKVIDIGNLNDIAVKEIVKIEREIEKSNKQKYKLLELLSDGIITKDDYKEQNDGINNFILEREKIKSNLSNEIEKSVDKDKLIEKFKRELDRYFDSKESIDEYIKEYLDKILVTKINGNKKYLKLDIYLKTDDEYCVIIDDRNKNKQKRLLIDTQRVISSNSNTSDYCINCNTISIKCY